MLKNLFKRKEPKEEPKIRQSQRAGKPAQEPFKTVADSEKYIETKVKKTIGVKLDPKTMSIDEIHYLIALTLLTWDNALRDAGLVLETKPQKNKKLW